MNRLIVVSVTALLLTGCASNSEKKDFASLARDFVYTSLSFSPAAATQAGYHQHGDLRLDAMLDDYSPAGIERQRRWYQDFRLQLLRSVHPDSLDPESRADHDMIHDQISLALLELADIQNYRHNPTLYVELIGNALYSVYTLQYAGLETRYQHIISRLRGIPALLDQARRNLTASPEIWTKVAQEENEGTIALIDSTLRQVCPAQLRSVYEDAARPALEALRNFSHYLQTDLIQRRRDWRLGRANYARKFRFVLGTNETPESVLAAAEKEMESTRRQMHDLALQFAAQRAGTVSNGSGTDAVIRGALDVVAKKHATPETYFADAARDLEEARVFVRDKDLVTLPAGDNLQVIETPVFMRGIYAVGGFNPAPALEPQLGAFYWLTPIPANWSRERVLSKLREYNYYGLKLLTIHEAIPGHYLQFEYANGVQPALRRLLRSVFGNGPYIEGWAVYATEMMIDAGYLNHDPGLRLTFLKQQLRVISNAILDIRLQTMGMTDEEAMELMINQAFQEKEEAEAKLRRAKLSSAQLPTYFVGWRDWHRMRDRYGASRGGSFSSKEFNERALKRGAVPLPLLSRLLTGETL
jgi:uncharacterized protein (DUF885 family)